MKKSPAFVARSNRLRMVVAALGTLTLAACGGKGSSSSTTYPANSFPAAYAVLGQTNFTNGGANSAATGSTGSVSAAGMAQPLGSAGSNGGYIYVPDTNNSRVLVYTSFPSTSVVTQSATSALGQTSLTTNSSAVSATGLAYPGKAFVTSDNKLIVADSSNNRILIWNKAPSASGTAPDALIGQTNYVSRTSGVGPLVFLDPTAAMLVNNVMVVVDSGNSRVLVWNNWSAVTITNGIVTTEPDTVIGQPDLYTATANNPCTITNPNCGITTGIAGQNNLSQPQDVWTDGYKLLIADTGNNRVMYWVQVPTTNMTNASYVIGQTSFTRVTGSVASSSLNTPTGITSDHNRIYIADQRNNRVLVYNAFPTSNGAAADTVIGQHDFTHNTANDLDQNNVKDDNPSSQTLNLPQAVEMVGTSNLFVTDSGNNRVMVFAQ